MLPPPPPPPPPFEYEDLTAATPPKKKEVIVHCRAGGKQQYTNAYIYFKVAAALSSYLCMRPDAAASVRDLKALIAHAALSYSF
jgi:hypothetical protein